MHFAEKIKCPRHFMTSGFKYVGWPGGSCPQSKPSKEAGLRLSLVTLIRLEMVQIFVICVWGMTKIMCPLEQPYKQRN